MLHLTLSSFIEYDSTTLRVQSRESTRREFKSQYEPDKIARYLKTLAAFSNHHGGSLLFGISDSPRSIIGVDESRLPDAADWQKRLRSHFEPAIFADVHTSEVRGKAVVIVSVPQSRSRPVICTKDANETISKGGRKVQQCVLQQGGIYFRYTAANDPIRFAELSEILRDREERRIRALLENLQIINQLGGPETIGIVSVTDPEGLKDDTQIYLSEQAAKNLNVIERGHFVENSNDGEPAYFIAGSVHLNKVVKEPLGEEDKNTPTEAAVKIKPTVQAIYGDDAEFEAQHLAKAAAWLGIRTKEKIDPRYVSDEKSLDAYITRERASHL
jgi:hypothetical protein